MQKFKLDKKSKKFYNELQIELIEQLTDKCSRMIELAIMNDMPGHLYELNILLNDIRYDSHEFNNHKKPSGVDICNWLVDLYLKYKNYIISNDNPSLIKEKEAIEEFFFYQDKESFPSSEFKKYEVITRLMELKDSEVANG